MSFYYSINPHPWLGVRDVHVHSSVLDDVVLVKTSILQVDNQFILIKSQ